MKMWMRPWTARNGFSEKYFKMANKYSAVPGAARCQR